MCLGYKDLMEMRERFTISQGLGTQAKEGAN